MSTQAQGNPQGNPQNEARGGRQGHPRGIGGAVRAITRRLQDDTGAATAEFAVVTMASVGFAGLLVAILKSDAVRALLMELIRHALAFAG